VGHSDENIGLSNVCSEKENEDEDELNNNVEDYVNEKTVGMELEEPLISWSEDEEELYYEHNNNYDDDDDFDDPYPQSRRQLNSSYDGY